MHRTPWLVTLAVPALLAACSEVGPTEAIETHSAALASWQYAPIVQVIDTPAHPHTFGVSWLADTSADATLSVKLGNGPVYSGTKKNVSGAAGWIVPMQLTPGAVYDYTITHGTLSFTGFVRIPDHASKDWFDFKFFGDSQHRTTFECDPVLDPDVVGCVKDANQDWLGGQGYHHKAVASAVGSGSSFGGPFYKTDHRHHPDVIVTLGDATVDNTDSSIFEFLNYESSFAGANHSPFFYALGNHDYWNEGSLGVAADPELNGQLSIKERYYSFDYNNVHVLVLDTGHDGVIDDDVQLKFAHDDLKKAYFDTNTDFTFVAMHRSLFSTTGSGDCAFGDAQDMIDKLEPLFKQFNVSAVFAGHNHQYQRFHGKGYSTPYFIVGTGGGQIYKYGDYLNSYPYGCRSSQVDRDAAATALGYLNARIGTGADGKTPIATFSFVPLQNKPPFAPLAPIDTFTIESRPAAPTNLVASIAGHLPAQTRLDWKDNSSREVGYRVEYQVGLVFDDGSGPWTTLPGADSLPPNSASFGPFSDPAQGQWVNYRVTALGTAMNNTPRNSLPAETTFMFPTCRPQPVQVYSPDVLLTSVTVPRAGQQSGQFTAPNAGTYAIYMTGNGDADLYVRKDQAPTLLAFDCRPFANTSEETCNVTLQAGQTAYYLVNGYAAWSSVQVLERTPYLTGATTSDAFASRPLLARTGLGANQEVGGQFTAPAANDYDIQLSGSGDADLYVRKAGPPTAYSYDCRPYTSSSNEHCAVHLAAGEVVYWMARGYGTKSYVRLAANTGQTLHLQWAAGVDCPAAGLVRYDIYRADEWHKDGDFNVDDWSKVGEVAAGAPLRFDDNSFSCQGYARYSVTAVYQNYESDSSNLTTVVGLATNRCKPDLAGLAYPTVSSMALGWADEGAGQLGGGDPSVERSTDGSDWGPINSYGQIDNWEYGSPSIWDAGLACNTKYYYRLAYSYADGTVRYSHAANGRTTSCMNPPSALSATPVNNDGSLKLTFTYDGLNPIDGFEVRRTDVAKGTTVLFTILGNTTTYRDAYLTCGKQYSYTVRAYREVYDPYSNTKVRHFSLDSAPATGTPVCN
jgi:hypothetical protein